MESNMLMVCEMMSVSLGKRVILSEAKDLSADFYREISHYVRNDEKTDFFYF